MGTSVHRTCILAFILTLILWSVKFMSTAPSANTKFSMQALKIIWSNHMISYLSDARIAKENSAQTKTSKLILLTPSSNESP